MRFQVPDELGSFHEARTNGSFLTVCPVNDLSASSRFASSTNATASWRFSRASSSVVPWVFAPGSSSTKAMYPSGTWIKTAVSCIRFSPSPTA